MKKFDLSLETKVSEQNLLSCKKFIFKSKILYTFQSMQCYSFKNYYHRSELSWLLLFVQIDIANEICKISFILG